jgi:uncharacterized protein (DUF111 family)
LASDRKIVEVNTKCGNIRVKLGLPEDKVNKVSPEHGDCAAAAALVKYKGEKVGL